jgi:site-specific recombinase XerD
MLEELRRRNFADSTIRSYLHGVEHFSRYFHRRPDQLGPEHIREYQAALFTKLKFSPNTVTLRLAALRFFYIRVLKRGWSIAETPYPKKVLHLPEILSQDEVARLIDAAEFPFHRILLMTLYATGARRAEVAHLKINDIDSQRMVIHIRGGKGRKDRCHAQPKVARCPARLLARAQAQANELAVSRQPMAYRKLSGHNQGPVDSLSERRTTRWA